MPILQSSITIQPSEELAYELGVRSWLLQLNRKFSLNYSSYWNFNRVLSSFFCTHYSSRYEKNRAYARMRKEMLNCPSKGIVDFGDDLDSKIPKVFLPKKPYNISHIELTDDLFVVVHLQNGKSLKLSRINHARKSIARFFEYYSAPEMAVPLEDLAKIVIAHDNMLPDTRDYWSPLDTHLLAKEAHGRGAFCVECFSGPYDSSNFMKPEDGKIFSAILSCSPFCEVLPEYAGSFPTGLAKFREEENLFLKIDPPHSEAIVIMAIESLVMFLKERPEGSVTTGALAIPQYVDLYEEGGRLGDFLSQLDYDIRMTDSVELCNLGDYCGKKVTSRVYILYFRGLLPGGERRKWDAEEPFSSRDPEGKWVPYIDRTERW